jgi:protein-arginine kinase activator protein McsA
MNYTIESAREDDKCYNCGEQATIVLVGPQEKETGYVDEVPLCESCAEERGV